MPTFDVDRVRVNLFHAGNEYIFSEYFEGDERFGDLKRYYDADQYRFAVPEDDIDDVTTRLEDAYYEPVLVEDLKPYCVVTEQYTKHANILRESAATWERRGNPFFLLPDELTVKEALEAGATPLEDTEFVDADALERLAVERLEDPADGIADDTSSGPESRARRCSIRSLVSSPPRHVPVD